MSARNRNDRNRTDEVKPSGELLRGELVETFDHARRAAGHAASGVSDSVVGRSAGKVRGATVRGWGAARTALAPLGEAARTKVKGKASRKEPDMERRWPVLAGLLAGGVAVGAAAAVLLRRRRRQWEGYEPDEDLDFAAAPDGASEELARQAAVSPDPASDNGQVADTARSASGGD